MARFATCLSAALVCCAPGKATGAIGDAQAALQRATASEAERYAPYETTLATLYLRKAVEEQDRGNGAQARALADDALRYADDAAAKAAERRAAAASRPPPPTIEHPRNLGGMERKPVEAPKPVPKQ
ncbi:MAG TPA: hypothetical protein VFP52_00505 [Myxococcales bacterium]|nr:hypothetical protein [Myxococcales bacterium]HET9751401.1 hypothetical protein [Myxococcales bacterium]